MASNEKKYDLSYTLSRIFALFEGDWKDITVIVIYAAAVGLASLAVPIAAKSLVNTVAFGTLMQPLVVLTSLVFGVLAFSGVMRTLQLYVVEILQRRILVRLALSLAHRIPRVNYETFRSTWGRDYILRFLEAFATQKTVKLLLLDGIAVLFQTVMGVILLGFYHPFFLAFSLALILLVFIFIFSLGRGGIKTSLYESDAKYDVFAWLQDLANIPVLFKSERGERYALRRADELVSRYLYRRSKHFRVLLIQNISALFIQTIGSAVLLGLGGYLVIKQQLTLGQLVAAELILTLVLSSVTKFGKHLETFYDLAASVAKLDGLIAIPDEHLSGSYFGVDNAPARLSVRNLSVHYDGHESNILEDISLELEPGEKVGIWGGNGSGKSSLANVIFRLAKPGSGRVEIDGHNVLEIHPSELRSEVVLLRGIEVFHGSILDNLTLGQKDIDSNQVRDALQMVAMDDEIYSFPLGIHTELRGDISPLSRGQAYKLMIARAILEKPRLLVIDGTLDSVDDAALRHILAALLKPEAPWTLLVLTHELGVLKEFDKAYHLDDGKLIPHVHNRDKS
jgi:putative ABC transport system ATP-binding protein